MQSVSLIAAIALSGSLALVSCKLRDTEQQQPLTRDEPAKESQPDPVVKVFDQLDNDRNGLLTEDEIGEWDSFNKTFGDIDIDNDGYIARSEFRKHHQSLKPSSN
jgi:Ca2+-binding EF-hand superfamily protein